jgi:2-dehydro-3-deoxyphosphogalactonate aldolase
MTAAKPRVLDALAATPLIAILRGIHVHESVAIVEALLAHGMRVVEVPLNSPQAMRSVRTLVAHFGDAIVCGAGTVLDAAEVDGVAAAGGQIVVSPNTDPAVIARAVELGLIPMPGAATPTEAFAALRAGARHLKMFPADQMGPATLKAWRSVLPSDVAVYPVGGVTPDNLVGFLAAGAAGVGIGSALYKPGMSVAEVALQARRFGAALRAARR